MKLLSLTEDYPPDIGGGATYAYEVSKRLKKNYGVDVSILTKENVLNDKNANFLKIKSGNYKGTGGMIGFNRAKLIYEMIQKTKRLQNNFDLINIYTGMVTMTTLWILKKLKQLKKPVVMSYINSNTGYWQDIYPFPMSNIYNIVEKELLVGVKYDKYVVLDLGVGANKLLIEGGVPKDKIVMHYQGVDCNLFKPAKKKKNEIPVIGFIGRSDPFKGIDLFISSIKILSKHTKNFKLLLRVDDNFKEKLDSVSKMLGIQKNISYVKPLPYNSLPTEFYNKCDLLVSLDIRAFENPEILLLTPCEAMACGTLVVSSSKPRKEWGKKTWITLEKSDPELLAKIYIDVLANLEKYKNITLDARKIAEKYFDWNKVTELYYKTFKSVI